VRLGEGGGGGGGNEGMEASVRGLGKGTLEKVSLSEERGKVIFAEMAPLPSGWKKKNKRRRRRGFWKISPSWSSCKEKKISREVGNSPEKQAR